MRQGMENDEQGGVLLATVKRIEIALGQSYTSPRRSVVGAEGMVGR
jgi:hypothetical protein